jgi:2-dehydropantoate 2-reductase
MGSGGVGGYFGARLVKGGADVHFVARGAHLAAMRARGLAVEGGPEAIHVPKVNVTDDPKTIGHVDLVMFCVKLWDTEDAARQLLPIMKPETGIISFQNGVQKDDMLRPIFGDKALMGGVAYVGTNIGRPGVIAQTGPLQRLVFGEYDGSHSPRAETFYQGLQAGRHQCRAQRRCPPLDLGEVRGAGCDVRRHHRHAQHHWADSHQPACTGIPA